MVTMIAVATLPLFAINIYLLISIRGYTQVYKDIVSNMVVANDYNLNFKESIDESCYKLVVGYTTFAEIDKDTELVDPYSLIYKFRRDVNGLRKSTDDVRSKMWLSSIWANLESLENRVNDIESNMLEGGHYDENLAMLDSSIYMLTELIQEDIQQYIYCQASNMGDVQESLDKREIYFLISSVLMIAAIATMITMIASNISRSVTKPIDELVDVTEKVATGDLTVRAGNKSEDELGRLSKSFNNMADVIEEMMSQIKEDEQKMRNTEIRLLQEQINPHFLYNALDTIVWLIETGEDEKATNMVMSLSEFFKLVLSHGKEYISIRDEELHVRSYLEIQQIRYADIMDYDINIDPKIYDYKVLKLTLQPIVENALYHGIKYMRAKGHISVSGSMVDGLIKLVVSDNGVGMSEDTLEQLRYTISRPCKDGDEGFGLANVNERIRINFGEEYGMQIESAEGQGTTVTVVIPALYTMKGVENDKN